MWLSDELTIQVVAKGGGRSEPLRSIGSKLHATQNDLALPVDDFYWPVAECENSTFDVGKGSKTRDSLNCNRVPNIANIDFSGSQLSGTQHADVTKR